ncbi:hypothetical protein DNU06_01575 [Putridiphycobacter roseus]|uniref:Secretion system C-terminal sorting domain-containing protein n=1 Tax=Putridiphycobacter roseus TaxID=2219161 RepID=A0A2W1N1P2_9FLAO|nr:T9SS type A sorting domain-containing protein [Putridiphycobacter roseus]PZE18549.1 hypothetical protein DNU06_01575 [Putridiphycobacter roseus]
MKKFSFILLLLVTFYNLAQSDTCLQNTILGISFPPVSGETERDFTQPHLDFLGVQKIRIGEDWSNREPSQGNFNWSPLENRLVWAETYGYDVLLTIQSNGPNWACSNVANTQSCVYSNNNFFKTYIDSLLIKYGDKISKIQFGNEWQSDFWYAGNANDFVQANNILYQSVQTHAPHVKVVLGGFTTISLRFLAGCNGFVDSFYDDDGIFYDQAFLQSNCPTPVIQNVLHRIDSVLGQAKYDIIDLHLYDDAEQWDEYFYNFIDTITKPILVSEFGGPNVNIEPATDAYQLTSVYDYIKKLDSLGISEAYFFKLVEGTNNPAHATSGLIDGTTLNEKPVYYLFKSFIGCTAFINQSTNEQSIGFYPNPMNEETLAQFVLNYNSKNNLLKIYDLKGRIVFKDDLTPKDNQYIIKKNQLHTGVYIVTINNEDGLIAKGKLVIE